MDPTVKAKWLEALRSGKYPQTRGKLRRTEPGINEQNLGYCCLGVLCDILPEHGKFDGSTFMIDIDAANPEPLAYSSEPPTSLLRAIQLQDKSVRHCIRMNDDNHDSFADIADWIERTL